MRRRLGRGPQPPAQLCGFSPADWPAVSVRESFELWHRARNVWGAAYPGSPVLGDQLGRIRCDYEALYRYEDGHGGPAPGSRSRGPRIQRDKGMR